MVNLIGSSRPTVRDNTLPLAQIAGFLKCKLFDNSIDFTPFHMVGIMS